MLTSVVHAVPALHAALFAATKKSSSGSSGFLFILLILAVGAFLFIRPQRRRQKEQMAMQKAIEPGDEVVTSSGIVGRVQSMTDDRVRVEVAPGTTVEIVRRAIGQRVTPPAWDQQPSSGGGQWNLPDSGPTQSSSENPPAPGSTEPWNYPHESPKPEPGDEHQGDGGEEHS